MSASGRDQEILELRQALAELENTFAAIDLRGGGGGGLDYADFAWGHYNLVGNTIDFIGGLFLVYGRGHKEVPNATVAVNGGTESVPQYVIVECGKTNIASAVIKEESVTNFNLNSATHWEVPIAKVYLESGASRIVLPRRVLGAPLLFGTTL